MKTVIQLLLFANPQNEIISLSSQGKVKEAIEKYLDNQKSSCNKISAIIFYDM